MRLILILTLGALLSGCAAQMLTSPGDTSKFGPSNEKSRIGTVKYLNQGMGHVKKSRRESAYKQMHAACGGKYKIVNEGPRAEGGSATNLTGGGMMFSSSEYWYINFQCE